MFSTKNFIISILTFRFLSHCYFIFVYDVKECSNLILLKVAVQFSQNHLSRRLYFLLCIFLPFLHTSVHHRCFEFWVSQVILVVKNLPISAGDLRDVCSVPGLGRSCGGGHSNPIQYSCLEDPMDRGTWLATVHRVTKRVRHDLAGVSLLLFFSSCSFDLYFCLCGSTILCASTTLISVTL